MKTGLSGSPRRTPRLRSSSPPQNVSSSQRSDGRRRRPESRQDVSPLTHRSINTPTSSQAQSLRRKGKGKNKPPEPVTAEFSDDDGNTQLNWDENADVFEHVQNDFDDGFDAGNDTVMADNTEVQDQTETSAAISPPTARKAEKPKPVSKPTNHVAEDQGQSAATQAEPEAQTAGQKRKGRGRPPKTQRPDNENENQRPSKKAKTADSRKANEPLDPELNKVVGNYVNRTGPLKGRSLYILKREVPAENSATHTRSGRASVRPLAYWRNERCVYGDGEAADGERYPMSTIKEIIRTEDVEQDKKRPGKRRGKKSKSKKGRDDDSDGEQEDYDPWEKEGGVLHGYIRKWDPEGQAGTDEEEVLGKSIIHCASPVSDWLQTSRMLLRAFKHEMLKTRPSASPNFSALRSWGLELLNCLLAASRDLRTRRRCTWCSSSAPDVYR